MVRITMNAKIMIAIIATFAMLFAGVAVASESADAADGQVTFEVGTQSYIKNSADLKTGLPALEDLGFDIAKGDVFKGWYVTATSDPKYEPDESKLYTAGSSLVEGATAYKASIETSQYTITFVDSDGRVISTIEKSENTTYGKPVATPGVKTEGTEGYVIPVGMVFAGWVDADGNAVEMTDGNITVIGDMTLKATYKADIKISFVVDGIVTYTHTMTGLVYPTDPVKESFTFVGWDVDGELVLKAGSTSKDFEALGLTADTTFTAVFEPAIYTVSFEVDGQIVATQTVKHGELATEPAFIPALEGMDFVEWDFDFAQAITGDTTIVAVFEPTPEPEPTGLANPTVQIMAIIIGVLAVFVVAMLIWKKDEVKVIIVKKLDKTKNQEEPKQ